jgi:hypothetical protein
MKISFTKHELFLLNDAIHWARILLKYSDSTGERAEEIDDVNAEFHLLIKRLRIHREWAMMVWTVEGI